MYNIIIIHYYVITVYYVEISSENFRQEKILPPALISENFLKFLSSIIENKVKFLFPRTFSAIQR